MITIEDFSRATFSKVHPVAAFYEIENLVKQLLKERDSALEGMKKRNEDLELKLEISNQKLDAFRHVYMENRELKERLKTAEDKLAEAKKEKEDLIG